MDWAAVLERLIADEDLRQDEAAAAMGSMTAPRGFSPV